MHEIINRIDSLITDCDELTRCVLGDLPAVEPAQAISRELPALINDIAQIYITDAYSSHLSDLPSWVEIIKKYIDALGGKDILLLLDIASYEIKENLIEMKSILLGGEQ